MATERGEFKYESLQEREAAVAYLQAIIAGLESGELSLSVDGKELMLHPQGLVEFRLAAKRGKHRGRLSVKLSWREAEEVSQEIPPLRIKPKAE